eukprot:CAMPEP_0113515594 /NCGR_PEP_ID=MMETSP0014_2-20120614/41069_1 /TAXON_ID=2857 /ORGANISM="Nitzschia sp." /LENGTH=238 /DNA_ID=CAMNT_0000412255 /DNA_START=28 /DNA_END=744 /DNA_ORIENTATION=+ /assembly_acc=CAM_ASM_000159
MTTSILPRKSLFLLFISIINVLILMAAATDDAPEDAVTCGSAVKLVHVESSSDKAAYMLNSEQKNLGTGSGQQIVTAVMDPGSTNALWLLRGPNDPESRGERISACASETAAGEPILCNSIIRLTHLETMRNLHSHNMKSPLSRQQEVSGYGQGDGLGDNGDDWKVICSAKYWRRESKVYFQHVDSGKFLGASSTVKFTHQNCGHSCPILNHLEGFARSSQDQYGQWFVEQGVHIHQS